MVRNISYSSKLQLIVYRSVHCFLSLKRFSFRRIVSVFNQLLVSIVLKKDQVESFSLRQTYISWTSWIDPRALFLTYLFCEIRSGNYLEIELIYRARRSIQSKRSSRCRQCHIFIRRKIINSRSLKKNLINRIIETRRTFCRKENNL